MYSETKPAKVRSGSVDSSCFRPCAVLIRQKLNDPATANHDITIVEHCRLSRSDGALRLVERNEDFVVRASFNHGRGGLVTMANLHGDSHGLAKVIHRDEVHAAGTQGARIKVLFPTDDDLLVCAAALNHSEGRASGHAASPALAHG